MQVFGRNHRPTHIRSKPANIFGQTMDDDVCSVLKWTLTIGCANVWSTMMRTGCLRPWVTIKHKPDRSDINKLEGWVDRGLEIHNARFIRYGLTQGAGSVEVNKTCPNPGAG